MDVSMDRLGVLLDPACGSIFVRILKLRQDPGLVEWDGRGRVL